MSGASAGSPDKPPLSDRFLVAFARAEEALTRLLGTTSGSSFHWLVRQAARRNAIVRSAEDDLLEYAELRNAVVHERGGGFVIAEPHPDVVRRLERIVELIENPPRIEDAMSRPVITCAPDEPVGEAARRMVEGDFSRIPVYQDGTLVGLLTSNALARWLATRLAGTLDSLVAETVRVVMGHGEAAARFEVVDHETRVADVVGLFLDATQEGRRLEAVIVTRRGAPDERPLGIVTLQDLPRLFALVQP